jgi:hypothetical protein
MLAMQTQPLLKLPREEKMASTAKPALVDIAKARAAAKDYMAKYDGPKIERKEIFGSRMIKQLYKRDYLILPRHALFLTFFARLVFDDSIINPLEQKIIEKVDKIAEKFDSQVVQAKAVMADAELTEEDMCANNLPEEFDIVITSPLYGRCIALLKKGDSLQNYYDTLWMNGAIKSEQYRVSSFNVKRDLRGVINSIRSHWIGLQKRIQTDRLADFKKATGADAASEALPTSSDAAGATPTASDVKPKDGAKPRKQAEATADLLTEAPAAQSDAAALPA